MPATLERPIMSEASSSLKVASPCILQVSTPANHATDSGQIVLSLGHFWPIVVNSAPSSTNPGRLWPNFAEILPVAHVAPNPSRTSPNAAQFVPFLPTPAECGQTRPNVGSTAGQISPNWARRRP